MERLFASTLDEMRWWVRHRLPHLNLEAMNAAASRDATVSIINDAARLARAVLAEQHSVPIELFNYFAMSYSSVAHHLSRARGSKDPYLDAVDDSTFRPVVSLIIRAAASLGIEPRFLAAPYLFENPYVRGHLAQFLPCEAETIFIEYNMVGTRAYERAAYAMLDAWRIGWHGDQFTQLMQDACDALRFAQESQHVLRTRLDPLSFAAFRAFYDPVRLPGPDGPMEGVNAGDQPWPFILDLAFGLGSRDVRRDEARRKETYLLPRDRDVLNQALENDMPDLLSEVSAALAQARGSRGEGPTTRNTNVVAAARALLNAVDAYARASGAHWSLVQQFIVDPSGIGEEATGSSGAPVSHLKTLMETRTRSERAAALRSAVEHRESESV